MAVCGGDIAHVPFQDIILTQVHQQHPHILDWDPGEDWGLYEETDSEFTSEWQGERVTFLDLTIELTNQHTVKPTLQYIENLQPQTIYFMQKVSIQDHWFGAYRRANIWEPKGIALTLKILNSR